MSCHHSSGRQAVRQLQCIVAQCRTWTRGSTGHRQLGALGHAKAGLGRGHDRGHHLLLQSALQQGGKPPATSTVQRQRRTWAARPVQQPRSRGKGRDALGWNRQPQSCNRRPRCGTWPCLLPRPQTAAAVGWQVGGRARQRRRAPAPIRRAECLTLLCASRTLLPKPAAGEEALWLRGCEPNPLRSELAAQSPLAGISAPKQPAGVKTGR